MKKLIAYLAIVFLIAGCCKEYCISQPRLEVTFQQFKAADTDTVYLVRYAKGTTILNDSNFMLNPLPDTGFSKARLSLAPDSDYKLTIGSGINKTFFITDIETETGECNCSGEKYNMVTAYSLNGQRQEGSLLFLQ